MSIRDYFQLFWIPAIVSGGLMVLLWAQGEFSGRPPIVLSGWFLLALTAQYRGTMASGWWIAGFGLQAVLAVVLLIKHQSAQF